MCCANSLSSASTYAAWCRRLTSTHCWCWMWGKAPRQWIVWWCQPPQEVGMQLGNPKYPYRYKHLVIVHGIGDQVPNETSLNPTTSLEYVDQIRTCRIAALRSQATRKSGFLHAHNSLC